MMNLRHPRAHVRAAVNNTAQGHPSLRTRAREAVARAVAYLKGRQSPNGGFCFYRSEHVDEPNLHDTYHAIAALTLVGESVPRADKAAQFLADFPLYGPNYYYYWAFSLDLLGRSDLIEATDIAHIQQLPLAVPRAQDHVVTSGWLESALQVAHLKRRFVSLSFSPRLVSFVEAVLKGNTLGHKRNLWDAWLCLSLLAMLDENHTVGAARSFVDCLQAPSFGFKLTDDSLVANVPVIYAGMQCCRLIGLPVRYQDDALSFVLACQVSSGGFSRTPSALPDIELTRQAIATIDMAEPDALGGTGRERNAHA